MTSTTPEALDEGPTFLGHPRGLFVLFFAEMWERFSYYGMRAILIFYLVRYWLFSEAQSNVIYGAYTALVYITPVLGGYLADRYLGQRKAVLFGAVLLAIGEVALAFTGTGTAASHPSVHLFWFALAIIIVGSGFLKANISVIVGQLYARTDVRRDGAYTIFYMGINVGATLGTFAVGYLGETFGWFWGFGAAGLGMLLGLAVFMLGKPALRGRGESTNPQSLERKVGGIKFEWVLYALSALSTVVLWLLLQYQSVVGWLLLVSGIALLGYILFVASKLAKEDRERIFAIVFLVALQPVFWGLFEQAGGSMNLFTDHFVNRNILGVNVLTSFFQSINPIYIVLLGPLFAGLWTFLGRRKLEPSTPAKFGLALLQMGLAFLVLVWGAGLAGVGTPTPVIYIFLFYLLSTTGELCLSPVGLSAMNRLAPVQMASLIMGAWFFATAGGNFVAGLIGQATGAGEGTGESASQAAYLNVYQTIGLITMGIGVAVVLVSPLVKRLMHMDTLQDRDVMAGQAQLAEPEAAGLDTGGELKPGEGRA